MVKSRHTSVIYQSFIGTQKHISEGRVVPALARHWVAIEISDNFYSFMQVAKALLRFRGQFDGNREFRHLNDRPSKFLLVRASS